ncbi:hypothetical protein CDD80_429 [Ophiocordyceps camponoti-rufipedis]|uniref:Mitochondrial intermembrane space import and assembly protein 40 n=1 Tax=Ophiocordyceps camponoti-rufipedis TaxID=2004952 RepID=A0A2C5ZCZ6_9HYPO|nr:hypothetical protein CDD80_429 [Ophiocordyceps camponoti-rufipedis]
MFCAAAARSASRAVPRAMASCGSRRLASTASPAGSSRSSRGTLLRWALAAGAVYYYNTSPIFADEGQAEPMISAPDSSLGSDLYTVDAVVEQRRKLAQDAALRDRQQSPAKEVEKESQSGAQDETTAPGEEDAGQGGAFNPETGEINWDCPCLGGMAHGPCGEEFKGAFSCFVYSEEEPKGMDCIEKFQEMQDCFRKHPDIYGAELEDDEPPEEAEEDVAQDLAVQQNATRQHDESSRDTEETRAAKETDKQASSQEPAKSSQGSETPYVGQTAAAEKSSESKLKTQFPPRDDNGETQSLVTKRPPEMDANAPWRDASVVNDDASEGEKSKH